MPSPARPAADSPRRVGAGAATPEGAKQAARVPAGESAYPEEREPLGIVPYTVTFPGSEGPRSADLEHAAPLPRVGDVVEYLDERGGSRRYRVRQVIHTLQVSAGMRPTVAERGSPAAFARDDHEDAEVPGDGGSLRAGLPRIILEEDETDGG